LQVHRAGEEVRIFSRNLEEMSAMFPEVTEAMQRLRAQDAIFEGEVLAEEITRSPMHTCAMRNGESGYALRFPRLVSFRDADKRPEDATTVAEIIALYVQQGQRSTT
jgi:ATP-dependent DNA ligase